MDMSESKLREEIERLKKEVNELKKKNASLNDELSPTCAGCGERLDGPHHAQCLDFE